MFDGDDSVVADHGGGEAGEEADPGQGPAIAEEVSQEHTPAGDAEHFAEDGEDLGLIEVVDEHAGEDVVERAVGVREVEGVAAGEGGGGDSAAGFFEGDGVEVQAGDVEVVLAEVLEEVSRDVARAGGDVEEGDGLVGFPGGGPLCDAGAGGAVVAEAAVDLADVGERVGKLGRGDGGAVHPLFFADSGEG